MTYLKSVSVLSLEVAQMAILTFRGGFVGDAKYLFIPTIFSVG